MRAAPRKNRRSDSKRQAERLDPHKEAVYTWETDWDFWNRDSITLKACRQLIETACAHYGVKPPRVRQHRGGYSWSVPSESVISMQSGGGKNPAVALHEATHHIIWHLLRNRPQDHGPTFLGVYLWLLERAGVAPVEALHASARKHGLKWRRLPPTVFSCKSRAA